MLLPSTVSWSFAIWMSAWKRRVSSTSLAEARACKPSLLTMGTRSLVMVFLEAVDPDALAGPLAEEIGDLPQPLEVLVLDGEEADEDGEVDPGDDLDPLGLGQREGDV